MLPWNKNTFQKEEIELCKQEMELFLLFPGPRSKNFFYKYMSFLPRFQSCFSQQKMELFNQDIKLFFILLIVDTSKNRGKVVEGLKLVINKRCSPWATWYPPTYFHTSDQKLIFQTGIFQKNKIISLTYWPLIKKLLYQDIFSCYQGAKS